MLTEIAHPPKIMTNVPMMIQPEQFKKDLDSYLKTRSPATFPSDLRCNLQVSGLNPCKLLLNDHPRQVTITSHPPFCGETDFSVAMVACFTCPNLSLIFLSQTYGRFCPYNLRSSHLCCYDNLSTQEK